MEGSEESPPPQTWLVVQVSAQIHTIKPSLTEEELANTSTQAISGKYNSLVIAKNLSMDITQFNRYNPDFDNMMSVNGNYDLRLPVDKMQVFWQTSTAS